MFQTYRKLLRIHQWHKNAVAFIPMLFAVGAQRYSGMEVLLAFFGFCCISSVSYILNDWRDREADRLHPTKKFRPLASGEISGKTAIVVVGILLCIDALIIAKLGIYYGGVVAAYLAFSTAYSLGLKNVPLLDSIMICINFTVRMLAGLNGFPDGNTYPYFVLVFCLILVFVTHKRRSDIKLLGDAAVRHKPVLKFYTEFNTYIVRTIAFVGAFAMGMNLHAIGALSSVTFALLACVITVTSTELSKHPEFAVKPHYLPKIWYWDVLVLAVVGSFFVEHSQFF